MSWDTVSDPGKAGSVSGDWNQTQVGLVASGPWVPNWGRGAITTEKFSPD